MKKIFNITLKRLLVTLVSVCVAAMILVPVVLITLFVVFPMLNDAKARKMADELCNTELPDNTEIVEVLSGCGNLLKEANHVDIWAGMLIKTELSYDEISNAYNNYFIMKVEKREKSTYFMQQLLKTFKSLRGLTDYEGYYIVETIGEPVSSYFDTRKR